MDTNQFKAVAAAMWMVVEADKFHLQVAKRLLSPEPLSERERAELLSQIAKREQRHEQMEAGLEQMRKVFGQMDGSA